MEPMIITAPMGIMCIKDIQLASMLGKKGHDDGDDDMMVSIKYDA